MKILITISAGPQYKRGDRVIANYGTTKAPEYWSGTVTALRAGMVYIAFDDGTKDSFKPTRSKTGLVGLSTKKTKRKTQIPTADIDKWLVVDMGDATPPRKQGTQKTKPTKGGSSLAGEQVVMTGFRDAGLESLIKENGGAVGSGVSGKTTILLVKDLDSGSSKVTKARSMGIPIMLPNAFRAKYKLGGGSASATPKATKGSPLEEIISKNFVNKSEQRSVFKEHGSAPNDTMVHAVGSLTQFHASDNPETLNRIFKPLFRFFKFNGGFYPTEERYLGFGNKEALENEYWRYDDPEGEWSLIAKIGSSKGSDETINVFSVLDLLQKWNGTVPKPQITALRNKYNKASKSTIERNPNGGGERLFGPGIRHRW